MSMNITEKIELFNKMSKYKQKSNEWLEQRHNYLTASTIAQALGLMGKKARKNLLINKSSDGILADRMLEIKCPYSRTIDGTIKTEYLHQMQEQMYVCEFDKCDFLECKFNVICDDIYFYETFDTFNNFQGIIIVYLDTIENEVSFMYSPIEYYNNLIKINEWVNTKIKQMEQKEQIEKVNK